MSALLCRGLCVRPVLQDIHLDLAAGECLGVVGPNGVGKSNRCINGNHRHRRPGARVPREAAEGFAPERRLARPEEDQHGDTNQRHR